MLKKPSAQPLYAALLNAQGRYLHDMFLYRTKGMKNHAEVVCNHLHLLSSASAHCPVQMTSLSFWLMWTRLLFPI